MLNFKEVFCISILTICLSLPDNVRSADIVTELNNAGATELVSLLKRFGLDASLTNGNFTIFAPTDAALQLVSNEIVNGSITATQATQFLTYHVISGYYTSRQFRNDHDYATLNGTNIRINLYNHRRTLMVNGVQVQTMDITADNGVIHIIDKTIEPPESDLVTTMDMMSDAHDFVKLIKEAGLDRNLMSPNSHVTIFMPSNFGFATNGIQLIKAPNSTYLTDVLKFHIVTHTYYSVGIPSSFHPRPWFHGTHERLNVTKSAAGAVDVNGAMVTQADIRASNGVIHVIDKVLYPQLYASVVG